MFRYKSESLFIEGEWKEYYIILVISNVPSHLHILNDMEHNDLLLQCVTVHGKESVPTKVERWAQLPNFNLSADCQINLSDCALEIREASN